MADRFMRKGTTKIHFVPTISAIAAATVAEIGAGEDITPEVAEINGFSFQNNPIQTPDMDSRFVTQVTGEDTAEASSFVMYELDGTDPIRAAMPKDQKGYVLFFYAGLAGASVAAADDYEAFPVTVASNVRQYTAGNEAAKYQVNMVIRDIPVEGTVAA